MVNLTIQDKIALMDYMIRNMTEEEVESLMAEVRKKYTIINHKPSMTYIIDKVCEYYNITQQAFLNCPRKKELVHARMVFAKIIADIYIGKLKGDADRTKKMIAEVLNMSIANVNKLLTNAKNFSTIYENISSEIAYLSIVIICEFTGIGKDE